MDTQWCDVRSARGAKPGVVNGTLTVHGWGLGCVGVQSVAFDDSHPVVLPAAVIDDTVIQAHRARQSATRLAYTTASAPDAGKGYRLTPL
jgi:hypothetical protein